MSELWKRQKLRANNAPDVEFEGHLLEEYSTQARDGSKDRWTELRLWQTRGGAWVAEQVGCSRRGNEADLRDVLVIEDRLEPEQIANLPNRDDYLNKQATYRRNEVMAFFGWSVVAKAFARQAGWDVVRRVG